LLGDGIDIGAGKDSLGLCQEFCPLMRSCRNWDLGHGNAQEMATVKDGSYDFVHSSHCLEHMRNPQIAINNWIRILKSGGHLTCLVPDEDLYEQGVHPSIFNNDHKFTFSIYKKIH
jgi:ubiquinone/menaquinone biosynthesis C-methylase UbiE